MNKKSDYALRIIRSLQDGKMRIAPTLAKEEQIPLTVDKDTKLYLLSPTLEYFEKAEESEFRNSVEENMFYGYHNIYVKDGKAFKIFQIYVP